MIIHSNWIVLDHLLDVYNLRTDIKERHVANIRLMLVPAESLMWHVLEKAVRRVSADGIEYSQLGRNEHEWEYRITTGEQVTILMEAIRESVALDGMTRKPLRQPDGADVSSAEPRHRNLLDGGDTATMILDLETLLHRIIEFDDAFEETQLDMKELLERYAMSQWKEADLCSASASWPGEVEDLPRPDVVLYRAHRNTARYEISVTRRAGAGLDIPLEIRIGVHHNGEWVEARALSRWPIFKKVESSRHDFYYGEYEPFNDARERPIGLKFVRVGVIEEPPYTQRANADESALRETARETEWEEEGVSIVAYLHDEEGRRTGVVDPAATAILKEQMERRWVQSARRPDFPYKAGIPRRIVSHDGEGIMAPMGLRKTARSRMRRRAAGAAVVQGPGLSLV